MRIRFFLILAALLYCTASFAQAGKAASTELPPSPAGTVALVTGDARLVRADKQSRRAAVGDEVYEGDTLVTGKDSELHLSMQDAGFMVLRPNTTLNIASYKADGGDRDNGIFKLVVGGLRSITGWIGKYNQKSYKVQTPTATIGIRGTDHETRYIPEGSDEGEPGTYDKVYVGETTIETDAGQAEVDANQAGFVPRSAGKRPRVLGSIPAFFRPGPNEDAINKKHAEIQKMIEQRREERRKIVAEKLAALEAARTDMKAQYAKYKAAGQERKAAAKEQSQDTEALLAALREKTKALARDQKAVKELRKTIQESSAADLMRNAAAREQLKTIRETARAINREYQEIQEAKKAIGAEASAAGEARKAKAEEQGRRVEEQGRRVEEQFAALRAKEKALIDKQNALEDERKNAGGPRQALRDAEDAFKREQKELLDAMYALYEDNMAATEARLTESTEQRRRTETQLIALLAREEALPDRQSANEALLEALQEKSAADPAKRQKLLELLTDVRAKSEAFRKAYKEILDARKTMHEKNLAAMEERRREAIEELNAMKAKRREVREKSLDLQSERDAMRNEIRSMYEQEQKRYVEELKEDRLRRVSMEAQAESN